MEIGLRIDIMVRRKGNGWGWWLSMLPVDNGLESWFSKVTWIVNDGYCFVGPGWLIRNHSFSTRSQHVLCFPKSGSKPLVSQLMNQRRTEKATSRLSLWMTASNHDQQRWLAMIHYCNSLHLHDADGWIEYFMLLMMMVVRRSCRMAWTYRRSKMYY